MTDITDYNAPLKYGVTLFGSVGAPFVATCTTGSAVLNAGYNGSVSLISDSDVGYGRSAWVTNLFVKGLVDPLYAGGTIHLMDGAGTQVISILTTTGASAWQSYQAMGTPNAIWHLNTGGPCSPGRGLYINSDGSITHGGSLVFIVSGVLKAN